MWMGRGGDEEQVEQRMFLYPSWLLKKVKVGKMHFWQSLASFSENNDGPVLCGRTVFEYEWELSWSCQCFSPPPSFNPHQNLRHCMSEWRNKTMFDNCFRLMKSVFILFSGWKCSEMFFHRSVFVDSLWFLNIRTIQNRFWDSAVTQTPFTEDDFVTLWD